MAGSPAPTATTAPAKWSTRLSGRSSGSWSAATRTMSKRWSLLAGSIRATSYRWGWRPKPVSAEIQLSAFGGETTPTRNGQRQRKSLQWLRTIGTTRRPLTEPRVCRRRASSIVSTRRRRYCDTLGSGGARPVSHAAFKRAAASVGITPGSLHEVSPNESPGRSPTGRVTPTRCHVVEGVSRRLASARATSSSSSARRPLAATMPAMSMASGVAVDSSGPGPFSLPSRWSHPPMVTSSDGWPDCTRTEGASTARPYEVRGGVAKNKLRCAWTLRDETAMRSCWRLFYEGRREPERTSRVPRTDQQTTDDALSQNWSTGRDEVPGHHGGCGEEEARGAGARA